MAKKYPALQKEPDYGWRLGLAALAAGEPDAAGACFEPLTAAGRRQAGAWYFLGRSLAAAGRATEAKAAYAQAARGPFGYYRLLAEGRLEKALGRPGPASSRWGPLLAAGPSGLDRDSLGFHLWITEKALSGDGLEASAAGLARVGAIVAGGRAAAGLNEELTRGLERRDWPGLLDLLRASPEAFRNLTPAARDLWPPLASAVAARLGDYRLAVSLMSAVKSSGGPGPKKWGRPPVYGRPVLDAWRRHGLSPALVLALIRAESAYQADVMSVSNARGLMQLLPVTAERVAQALGEPPPGDLDLFDPALNIRYGSWYLAALLGGFGHEALALAGYNGGPFNVKSLLLARPGTPLDIFIESLPREETVAYVKKIIAGRCLYEEAYFGWTSRPDLTVPAAPPRDSLPDF